MEHRWHARRPLRIESVLYRRECPVAICRSRDVSEHGMFLELDAEAIGLEAGTGVKVEMTLEDPARPRRHRVSGIVVHAGRDGVGVLFAGRNPALASTGEEAPLAPGAGRRRA